MQATAKLMYSPQYNWLQQLFRLAMSRLDAANTAECADKKRGMPKAADSVDTLSAPNDKYTKHPAPMQVQRMLSPKGQQLELPESKISTCTEARRGAATLLLETKRVPATGHVVENAILLVTPMLSEFCKLCRATDQAQVGPSSLTVHYPCSYFDPEIILLYFSPGRVCRRPRNTMGNALGPARLSSLRQAPCGQINGGPGPKQQEPYSNRATDLSHWKRQQACCNSCCRSNPRSVCAYEQIGRHAWVCMVTGNRYLIFFKFCPEDMQAAFFVSLPSRRAFSHSHTHTSKITCATDLA